jgi:regulator of sirC expression with transglutaminase-like and TPR domain
MEFSIARQRLYSLLHRPEPFSLAEAALYIALEEYPDLQVETYVQVLDNMAAEVSKQLPSEFYPLRILQTINRYLFEEKGFCGNERNYYDARNSFLNEVLDRRTGIPITLSLVYLEIADRIGFPMVGINFPGHFLICPQHEEMDLFIDPFHKGELLFLQDCKDRLEMMYQRPIGLFAGFFEVIKPQQFLVRMLTNLKHIYLDEGNLLRCLSVSERILLIDPEAVIERRDRGLMYYQLGRWVESRQDLEDYLGQSPWAEDRSLIFDLLERMTQNR